MQIQKTLSKSLLLALLLCGSAQAQTFEEYKAAQQKGFGDQKKAFLAYKKEQEEAFTNYKKELLRYWKNPKTNTKKELVHYAKDQKSRTIIDFAHNKVTLQAIAKSKKDAQQQLALALAQAATFSTKDFFERDALEKKLLQVEKKHHIPVAKPLAKPVLAPIFFEKKPTHNAVKKLVTETLSKKKIAVSKAPKSKKEKLYTLQIALPKNATLKRAALYTAEVQKASNKEKLPPALIFAVMETESSFNPMARSYVPAYGLMQIVPKTAGIDAYNYLYGKKRLVGSGYLYNANNNITMGSAYLHILYFRYLKRIKDPKSRLYCTIAAYNTGAGNVSRAFGNTKSTYKAAQYINKLSSEEVYAKLLRDLPYEEPKHYLKNVTKRMDRYNKLFAKSNS